MGRWYYNATSEKKKKKIIAERAAGIQMKATDSPNPSLIDNVTTSGTAS